MQEDNTLAEAKHSSCEDVTATPELLFKISPLSIIYRYMFLILISIIGISIFVMLLPTAFSGKDYLTGGLLLFWALALAKYWLFILSMPYQIYLTDDGNLKLRSLFIVRELSCKELVLIQVSPFHQTYLKITTSDKKTYVMINHVDGLHELIKEMKTINPGLETKGC